MEAAETNLQVRGYYKLGDQALPIAIDFLIDRS